MRIEVDRERCIGAGMCTLTAPDVFDQDEEDGRVVLLDPEPPEGRHPAARTAEASCPSGAISVLSAPDPRRGG